MAAHDETRLESPLGKSTIRFAPIAGLAEAADPGRAVVVADALSASLVPPGFSRDRIAIVARGEEAKSLAWLERLFAAFLELGVTREWTVAAVGGGSVCDLAGFAAATWMRGLDTVLAPTTLLAMVDASVGGKNGIDFRGIKNLVGSFALPRLVLMDTAALEGLPEADLARGLSEAVKHGILDGREHFSLVERAVDPAGRVLRDALGPVIRASVRCKAALAMADADERGDRRLLNLGHSYGHAIESVSGLPHGDCVAAGLGCALRLGLERGGSPADAERAIGLLGRLGLPTGIEAARLASGSGLDGTAFRAAVASALGSDKKRSGDCILFALPLGLGSVRVESIPLPELEEFARRAP